MAVSNPSGHCDVLTRGAGRARDGTRQPRMGRRRTKTDPQGQPRRDDAGQAERGAHSVRRWVLLAVVVVTVGAAMVWGLAREREPPVYGFEVVHAYPHDPQAYTQGLVYAGGVLYEGTGKYGESTLRRVALGSGKVLQAHALDRSLFGEGIALWDGQIVQLTWRNSIAIVYDQRTFRELRRFEYRGEGWGLTHDGRHLIMSDGSATLRFLDPQTFRVVRELLVQSRGRRVGRLNELEYVRGEIFANVWYQDHIARISPRTGEVIGWIDLRGLWPQRSERDAVLNGIAYDAQGDRLFVTGKDWPKLYEIRLTR
jgi:glutaminyl-peptide cyclotransferase